MCSPAASAAGAKERCGPPLKADGEPALVAIVMDGISSAEPNSGTSRPLRIRNWCPARPDGSERHMPPGIENGYRTWAGLATANGQHPQTTTCRPAGGLKTNACLVARLADAGAIVLPYSYAGTKVSKSGAFTFTAYDAEDTYQPPAASIANLNRLIQSIASAWPSAQIVIVAHSYGGTVASGWWETRAPDAIAPVQHIFTLDSPLNGVAPCAATAVLYSPAVGAELCRRWDNRDAFDAALIARNRPVTLTPIGTIDDPTYAFPIGQLRAQLLYKCPDPGDDPASRCIAAPSVVSTDPECSGTGPGVMGRRAHHAVIGCPRTTRTILAGTSPGLVVNRGGRGRRRPHALVIGRDRATRLRWSDWDRSVAHARGLVRGHRRTIELNRPRPCDGVRRFAFTRARIAHRRPVPFRCPARL
jgi:hypothetical protein